MATPKVAPWPAIPISKPEEVYAGLSDQAKEYPLFLESIVRQEHNFEKPEALSRLRVLDCSTRMMIGHWCSSMRSEEHTSELQSRLHLVCRLLLEKKKKARKTQ